MSGLPAAAGPGLSGSPAGAGSQAASLGGAAGLDARSQEEELKPQEVEGLTRTDKVLIGNNSPKTDKLDLLTLF